MAKQNEKTEKVAFAKILEQNKYSLYNSEWVRKAAEDGYDQFLKTANEANPNATRLIEHDNFWFELLYYSAFESALNTFLHQVLKDGAHDVSLYLDELHKITATIIDNSTK